MTECERCDVLRTAYAQVMERCNDLMKQQDQTVLALDFQSFRRLEAEIMTVRLLCTDAFRAIEEHRNACPLTAPAR